MRRSLRPRRVASISRGARRNAIQTCNQDGGIHRGCNVVVGTRLERQEFAVDRRVRRKDEYGTVKIRRSEVAEEFTLLAVFGIFKRDQTCRAIGERFSTYAAQR